MSTLFRTVDSSGDWVFGSGKQAYASGSNAIALDLRTGLKMFLNDCFFAMDQGIDWWNLLGGKNPYAQNEIVLEARKIIAGTDGVVRINEVDVVFDSTARKLTVTYNVDTIYSQSVAGSVSPA